MLLALVYVSSDAAARGLPATQHEPAAVGAPRRVGCDEVIRKVDHDKSVRQGYTANVFAVAKALGTSSAWVEHCMGVYGRQPRHASAETGESEREERLEDLEENEPEERMSEDIEAPGEREQLTTAEAPDGGRRLAVTISPTGGSAHSGSGGARSIPRATARAPTGTRSPGQAPGGARGRAVGLLRQAGQRKSIPEVVAVALREEL